MLTAYIYNEDGSPMMQQEWHCGRVTGTSQSRAEIESCAVIGEVIELIAPYGVRNSYKVVDADDKVALLQRV